MGLNSVTRKLSHLAKYYILFKTSSIFQLETQYHFCGELPYSSKKPLPYPAHPQTVCQCYSNSKCNFILGMVKNQVWNNGTFHHSIVEVA